MISRDVAVSIGLSFACAAWVTLHVALVVALVRSGARRDGAVAFLVVPLAPVIGARARLWTLSALWCAAAVTYGLLRWRAGL